MTKHSKAWGIQITPSGHPRTTLAGVYFFHVHVAHQSGCKTALFDTRAAARKALAETFRGEFARKAYRPRVVRVGISLEWAA